jgi:hypothetical protein
MTQRLPRQPGELRGYIDYYPEFYTLKARLRLAAKAGRKHAPHLRCGICDEPFQPNDQTTVCDDEKCHVGCEEENR